MAGKEKKVLNFLSDNNIYLTRKELRTVIHGYNDFKMPVGERVTDIVESKDSSFIEYTKKYINTH